MNLTIDLRDNFEKAKQVLLRPNQFFKFLKKEKGWKKALSFFLVWSLVSTLLGLVNILAIYPNLSQSSPDLFANQIPSEFNAGTWVVVSALSYVVNVFLTFAWAGGLHLATRIFKSKISFDKTYQVYVYTRTPTLLLSWLPVISGFAWIYSFVLLFMGLRSTHKLSKTNTVILLVLVFGIAVALLSALVTNFAPTL